MMLLLLTAIAGLMALAVATRSRIRKLEECSRVEGANTAMEEWDNARRKLEEGSRVDRANTAMEEWDNVPADYFKILELNRRFIRGELYCTPYDSSPLDEATNHLRENHLRLHDFGLLTIGIQPFTEADCLVQGDGWHGRCPDPMPNVFSQRRQRPWVEFVLATAHIDRQHCQRFISGLVGRTEIYTTYFLPGDTETKRGNIPRDTHPVTLSRQARELSQVKHKKWKGISWVNSKPNAEWPTMDVCNFNDKVATGQPIEIMVAGKSWDEDPNILEIILEEAAKAGMIPRFAEEST